MGARTSCSCPRPENAPVLPTWIVNVDFSVSRLCCWALTACTHNKNAAAKNTGRLIAHLKTKFPCGSHSGALQRKVQALSGGAGAATLPQAFGQPVLPGVAE